jgi:cell division control protein 6
MEQAKVRTRIVNQIHHMVTRAVIKDRRFLDDEQLIRSEQLEVLEEIFNANVREAEIQELSSHFAGVLRGNHPCHLAIWGKTGTGKTLTMNFFLNLLSDMAVAERIPIRFEHLDLSTPRPSFRALNDLACLLNAAKRYKRGVSLEELMQRIEKTLTPLQGYLIIFVDEIDNVRRDRDAFLSFLVRRLPQRIKARLILVFASNKLNWPDYLDPRVKSFLKMNELLFKPYDGTDLRHILRIRVEKALCKNVVAPGVVEKIAGIASRDHGDARRAVALLAKSAYLAEKAGSRITLTLVDEAGTELDRDRYVLLIRTAPVQLQAAMAAVIEATWCAKETYIGTGEAYDSYRKFCEKTCQRALTGRAFGDMLMELDMYALIRSRVHSRGRYGRTREIVVGLPEKLVESIYQTILANFDVEMRASPSHAGAVPARRGLSHFGTS